MNLFELFVKIGVDDQASAQISKITKGLGKGVVDASKVALKAVAAVSAGVATLSGVAIKQYAEYEQLVGGVETLFKASSGKVQEYAAQAYKSANMSANQYMETVTSFSASLLQSLAGDTAAAADKADMAIRDMADNANKMGSDLETLRTAYAGFAKGQFMLLDNLKLGYGGTKEEMERLLKDAQAISGIKYDISSYADIVDAIHVIQTEMGITGTTAKEAATTIQGSVGMMKSALSNLMTSLADENADSSKNIDEFVDSVSTVYDNIAPKAKVALNGVLSLTENLFPKIADSLPQVLNDFVPNLVKTAINVIRNLAQSIKNNAGEIVGAAKNVVFTFIDGVVDGIPDIIDAVNEIVDEVVDIIPEVASKIVKALPKVIYSVARGLNKGTQNIVKSIAGWFTDIPDLAEQAMDNLDDTLSGVVLFSELMEEAASKQMDLTNALSKNGRTISEVEDDIREAEGKVTQIISNALKSQQGLRDDDIESIRKYNDELRRIEEEKLSIYRDQQLAELRKAQYGLSSAETTQDIAEYAGKAEAALKASNDAVNQIYDAQLIAAENYYKSIGEVGTQAHADELAKIEQQRKEELAVNQDYYNQTIGLVSNQSAVLAQSALETFSDLEAQQERWLARFRYVDQHMHPWAVGGARELYEGNEWLYRMDADIDKAYADYFDALDKIDHTTANAFIKTAFEAKKGGQELSDETRAVIGDMLSNFEDLPGTLGEETKKTLLFLLSDLEEYIPELKNASEMSVDEIKDVVDKYINYDSGADSGESWADGIVDGMSNMIPDAFGIEIDNPVDEYAPELYAEEQTMTATTSRAYRPESYVSMGDVNINIDGARYNDERSLAAAVSTALQDMFNRRVATYG